MTADDLVILSRITRLIAVDAFTRPLTTRLAEAAGTILGASGLSITLDANSTHRITVAATDQVSARLEELQDVCSEGPCWQAQSSGVSQILDLEFGTEDRWPQFEYAAFAAVGSRRLISMPMQPYEQVLGVLSAHVPRGGSFAMDQQSAEFLVNAIGAAILRDPEGRQEVAFAGAGPWSGRAQVQQAIGMVMAQLTISDDDALALLRAHAFAHTTTVDQLAVRIIARTTVFDEHDG